MKTPSPENIKAVFDTYYPVDIKFWVEFAKVVECRSFAKNEIVKGYDKTEKFINILVSGSVGHFMPYQHKDICINLYYENQLFSDYLSFISQRPTVIKTECLEDTELWSVSHQNLQELYAKSDRSLLIGKAISDIMFTAKQSEQINLLTLPPTERYLKLIKSDHISFSVHRLKLSPPIWVLHRRA